MNIKTKIILSILSVIGIISITCITILTTRYKDVSKEESIKSLDMLSQSILSTLEASMMIGDRSYIDNAIINIKNIKGLQHINIYPSNELQKNYNLNINIPNQDIANIFSTKKTQSIIKTNDMQLLKPLIANNKCVQCHTFAKEGDVLGVIDIGYDFKSINEYITVFTQDVIYSIIIISVIGIILIIYLMDKIIFRRLKTFANTINELMNIEKTHEVHKIKYVNKDDEIGTISVLFNNYIEYIEENLHKQKLQEIDDSISKALHVKLDDMIAFLGTPAIITDENSIINYYNIEFSNMFDELIDQEIYIKLLDKELNLDEIILSSSLGNVLLDFKDEVIEFDQNVTVDIQSSSFINKYAINIKRFNYQEYQYYLIIFIRVDNDTSN